MKCLIFRGAGFSPHQDKPAYPYVDVVLSVMMWKAFHSAKAMEAAAIGTVIVLLVIPVIFCVRNLMLARVE